MKVQTSVKSGGIRLNHNEKQVREAVRTLKVQTNVKAGGREVNHNEKQVREAAKTLKVKTNVKAGSFGLENPTTVWG